MSKKDAYKEILDLVEKKAQRSKEMKEGSKDETTHVQEVLKFLDALDRITVESTNELDFTVAMERECKLLAGRLKTFDPYMNALVEWNNTKDWKELRPLGVRIRWSKYFLKFNPDAQEDEYIDVGRLLLDDF